MRQSQKKVSSMCVLDKPTFLRNMQNPNNRYFELFRRHCDHRGPFLAHKNAIRSNIPHLFLIIPTYSIHQFSNNLKLQKLIFRLQSSETRTLSPERFSELAENKRSWRYVAGILRRWTAEGRENRGDVERGKDGKSGRHTETDHRKKYLEDYQRRWGKAPR